MSSVCPHPLTTDRTDDHRSRPVARTARGVLLEEDRENRILDEVEPSHRSRSPYRSSFSPEIAHPQNHKPKENEKENEE